GLRHGGKVDVDKKKECKKLGGLKNDLAHCGGLRYWFSGDSSKGSLQSSSLRGINLKPSVYLIK
ncbi:MAG: hypothetical protein DM484_21810, partial [Candidatus Methylumidiphilus alinenensis]